MLAAPLDALSAAVPAVSLSNLFTLTCVLAVCPEMHRKVYERLGTDRLEVCRTFKSGRTTNAANHATARQIVNRLAPCRPGIAFVQLVSCNHNL